MCYQLQIFCVMSQWYMSSYKLSQISAIQNENEYVLWLPAATTTPSIPSWYSAVEQVLQHFNWNAAKFLQFQRDTQHI